MSGVEMRTSPECWLLHDILLDAKKDRWPNHMFNSGIFESYISRTCAKHAEDCKAGVDDLIAQKFELNVDFTLMNCQTHRTAVFMFHPPTVTQTTSIMEPSWIDTINVPNDLEQVHQPQHNQERTDQCIKQVNHDKVIGSIMVVDIHKTCGAHQSPTIDIFEQRNCNKTDKQGQTSYKASCITHTSCRFGWSLWLDSIEWFRLNTSTQHSNGQTASQKDHLPETDGHSWHFWPTSWLTSHLLKAVCQFLLRLWIFYFPPWANVAENLSLYRQARNKSQFIAQQWLRWESTTRMPTWTTSQYFHQKYRAGGDSSVKTCVSKFLKHSPERRLEHHQAPSCW